MTGSNKTIPLRKKIMFTVVAGSVALIVLLVLFELLIRIFFPQELYPHPKYLYVADKTLGYRLNPNFSTTVTTEEYSTLISINRIGIRDKEVYPKKKNEFRILGLGDSFTFAQQVDSDSTYLKLIEQNLRKAFGGRSFSVFNAGVNGYGTEHELQLLRELGHEIDPDIVILGFYIGNDFNDNLIGLNTGGMTYRTVKDGYLVTTSEGGRTIRLPNFIRTPLRKHSHLYFFVKSKLSSFLNRFRYKSIIEVFSNDYSPDFQNGVEYTFDLILGIKEWCDSHDAQLLIIVIPSRIQVDREYRETIQMVESEIDLEKPNRLILEYCDKNGIKCLDLQPHLMNHPSRENLFFNKDNHWTPDGHKIVSDHITGYLLNSDIIR